MSLSKIQACAEKNPRAFFWRIIVPCQTILLSCYGAPMYGFNALIVPINETFANGATQSWQGAFAGGLLLFGSGFGALLNGKLIKLSGSPLRLLVILNFLTVVAFAAGALSCKIGSETLLFFGFALPAGLIFSNLYALCVAQLLGWARLFNKAGLQSGLLGLSFGIWGALYSFYAPVLGKSTSFLWLLIGTGIAVMIIGLLSTIFFAHPPEAQSPDAPTTPEKETPKLGTGRIFRLAPYWLFFIFFMIFLIPGFGFKIIVQELSTHVFNADSRLAAIMAVAYLITYGLSRLVFGILSDRVNARPLYLSFTVLMALSLLVSAITLPTLHSVLIFTILMCLVGGTFAAGKCIWMVLLLKLYGPVNFNTAVHATLPAYGLAGLLGPVSLNYALGGSGSDLPATSLWLYIMAGGLALSFVIFLMLKRVDYGRIKAGQSQAISITLRSKGSLTTF